MVELEEAWVPLEGMPNYEVSNFGRIANVNTNQVLKPYTDKDGYQHICLYKDGIKHYFLVHRLVAKCFFLNYQEGIEVNFENGDPADVGVFNLTLGHKCRKADE